MREILLYLNFFSFVAEQFVIQAQEAKDAGQDITVRISSAGGGVLASWGMIAKLREHPGDVIIKVDGMAMSMAAYFLLFFDNVSALPQSRFMLHRASFDGFDTPSDAEKQMLAEINRELEVAMKSRLDIKKFEALAGVTIKEFFTNTEVVDVHFDAKSAKNIGLIKKISNLAPEDVKALDAKIAACYGIVAKATDPITKPEQPKETKMTLEEIKSNHPALYSEIMALGVKKGISKEKDRVGSWLAWQKTDPKAVAAGIKGGKKITGTEREEFHVQAIKVNALETIEAGNADETDTNEFPAEVSKAIADGNPQAAGSAAKAAVVAEGGNAEAQSVAEKKATDAAGVVAAEKNPEGDASTKAFADEVLANIRKKNEVI